MSVDGTAQAVRQLIVQEIGANRLGGDAGRLLDEIEVIVEGSEGQTRLAVAHAVNRKVVEIIRALRSHPLVDVPGICGKVMDHLGATLPAAQKTHVAV